jgi:hypothetical protein
LLYDGRRSRGLCVGPTRMCAPLTAEEAPDGQRAIDTSQRATTCDRIPSDYAPVGGCEDTVRFGIFQRPHSAYFGTFLQCACARAA